MPGAGSLVNEQALTITLDAVAIEGFPEAFEWRIFSTIRAFRDEPDPPRAEDEAPDEVRSDPR